MHTVVVLAVLTVLLVLVLYNGLAGILVPVNIYCLKPYWHMLLFTVNGTFMALEFIHSVHLEKEVDVLAVTFKGFYLVSLYAPSPGAGVPASPAELGGGKLEEKPGIVITDVWVYRGLSLLIDLGNAYSMKLVFPGFSIDAAKCKLLLVYIDTKPPKSINSVLSP